jgi:hypothetical protein
MEKMKIGVKEIMFFGLLALVVACGGGETEKYVLGEKIYIKYMGVAKDGDWIKIDDVKFMHISPDTTGQGSNQEFNFNTASNDTVLNEENVFLLPVTNTFDNAGGSGIWMPTINSSGDIATELISQINLANYDESDVLLEKSKYGYEGNQLTIASGEIIIFRKDGEKIKVSTSDGYPAYVGKESHRDYLKKINR